VKTCNARLEQLADPVWLLRAVHLAARERRRRPDVAWGVFRAEALALALSEELLAGTWRPAPLTVRLVCTPKPRPIACPRFEDRVLHAALVSLVEPWWRARARPESMACRPGAGNHRAVWALAAGMAKHKLVVHLDLRAYFPSVCPLRVHDLLTTTLRDERLVTLVDHLIKGGLDVYRRPEVRRALGLTPAWPPPNHGLALGSSVSRWIANHVLLDALDHHIKRELKVPGYLRYLDDLFLFGDRRGELRGARDAVVRWLHEERGLRVKDATAPLQPCAGRLNALGHEIRRGRVEVMPRALRRLRVRLRGLLVERGPGGSVRVARSMASTAGVLMFGA
jgi:RNA-directed DNA polymerase